MEQDFINALSEELYRLGVRAKRSEQRYTGRYQSHAISEGDEACLRRHLEIALGNLEAVEIGRRYATALPEKAKKGAAENGLD